MTMRSKATSIDEYIAEFPESTQKILQEVRSWISEVAPNAVETMSYAMPTFDLNKRHLVHFAAYEHHIGFYPTPRGLEAFEDELEGYKRTKGAVQFPIDKPMPKDLIQRITQLRVAQEEARSPRKKS